jgi:hypothetical protein
MPHRWVVGGFSSYMLSRRTASSTPLLAGHSLCRVTVAHVGLDRWKGRCYCAEMDLTGDLADHPVGAASIVRAKPV